MKDKKITPDDIEISRTDNSVSTVGNIHDNDYVLTIKTEDNTVTEQMIETIIRYMITCGESKIYYPNEDKLIVY